MRNKKKSTLLRIHDSCYDLLRLEHNSEVRLILRVNNLITLCILQARPNLGYLFPIAVLRQATISLLQIYLGKAINIYIALIIISWIFIAVAYSGFLVTWRDKHRVRNSGANWNKLVENSKKYLRSTRPITIICMQLAYAIETLTACVE